MAKSLKYAAHSLKSAPQVGADFSVAAVERELLWREWFPAVDWPPDEVLADDVVDVLFAACVAFFEGALSIRVPGQGQVPLRLRPAQKEVLRSWIKYRNTVSLKARQIGFSTLVAAFTLWMTFGYSDRLVVMLSRTERESIKLLGKVKYNYKSMPAWVRDRGPKLLDRTKQTMTFDNDSSIESLPSANDPARGESVFAIVVDEWAFLPSPDEAWASIEPVADIGGRIIGISTARGQGNFFHNLWLGSQQNDNGFHGVFFPWWAVDQRDEEWYERKRKRMPGWLLAQEYPATPEEAFVGSGNPVFNLDVLRQMETSEYDKFWIEADKKTNILFASGSSFEVMAPPNHEDRYTYVVGADIAAGGEMAGDYSVAHVICVNTREIVAVWRGHVEPDVFGAKILPAIGWYYRYAAICPEINNHGLTTLKALQGAGYSRIYKRRTFTKKTNKAMDSLGWLTTHTSKPLMIDELAAYLRDVNVWHKQTLAELMAYSRDENGKMSGSPHDDCVMSLALAVQCLKYAHQEKFDATVPAARVPNTMAWWEAQLDSQSKAESKKRVLPRL